MTNEELVELYQKGNKQVLEQLIEQNTGIVKKLAKSFCLENSSSIDEEDLEQEGRIGLMIAADRYNPNMEHPAKFITYAIHWIYSKMSRFLKCRNTNNEISIYNPLSGSEDLTIEDSLKDSHNDYEDLEEEIERKQLREELEGVIRGCLTLKQQECLKLYCGWDGTEPMTFQAIGELFETRGSNIRQHIVSARLKIRKTSWGRNKVLEVAKEEERRAEYKKYDSYWSMEDYEVAHRRYINMLNELNK